MAFAVIMAGGQGERFWPMTHKKFPKYRIRLDGKVSLLQRTYSRLRKLYSRSEIFVVTTRDQARMIREELKLDAKHIFIEPLRRNTGPAIYLATSLIAKHFGKDAVVTFYPADHLIQNEAAFQQTIKQAIKVAKEEDCLVTVGIKPTFPATGYGYIEAGRRMGSHASAFHSKRFVEKPKRAKAKKYLRNGKFLWNGGIFTWKTGIFLRELQKHSPELSGHLSFAHLSKSYHELPKVSIDVTLLEKTKNIAIVKTVMDWCDMGSWDMLHEKGARDAEGTLALGEALSQHKDSKRSLLVNTSQRPLITLGVSDLVVVQTDYGTLVCKKGFSEEAARLCAKIPNRF
jgi:mannose-1-phosphate guanylyltransferase